MSEIEVSKSGVREDRYYVALNQDQVHELIIKACADAAGVDLSAENVHVRRIHVSARDSMGRGPHTEAVCELVVDLRSKGDK